MTTIPQEFPATVIQGDGVTRSFLIGFSLPATSSLVVELDGDPQAQGVHYVVDGDRIVFTAPPWAGVRGGWRRATPIQQGKSFPTQPTMLPQSVEGGFNERALVDQELAEKAHRALSVPLGETAPVLPSAPPELMFVGRDPDGSLIYLDPSVAPGDLTLFGGWRSILGADPAALGVRPDGRPATRPLIELLGNGYDNTPILDWVGLWLGWGGTSIPHIGAGVDGYPELTGRGLQCAGVVNMAWSSSHATWLGEPVYGYMTNHLEKVVFISSPGMTERDRLAGLALYGPTSAFHDDFDLITKASQQTCDARIRGAFAIAPLRAYIHDWGHNDVGMPQGTATPPAMTVTGVTFGATTTLTVSSLVSAPAGLVVGAGLAIRLQGVPKLAYGAGRVMAINTVARTITLGLNTTGYTGALTGGVAEVLDRSTIFGVGDFLIHYTYWAALDAGTGPVQQILAGPPSEFSGGGYRGELYQVTRRLQALADKWGLPFFDAATALKVTAKANKVFFGDTIHPTELSQRKAIARVWIRWMLGGATDQVNPTDYVQRGAGDWAPGRPLEWSEWLGGVGTPSFTVTGRTAVFTEDFDAIDDWIAFGSPTLVPDPLNPGIKALRCSSVGGSEPFIVKLGVTPLTAISMQVDISLNQTVGLVADGQFGQATLIKSETSTGPWLTATLVAVSTGAWLQIGHFSEDGGAVSSYLTRAAQNKPLAPATKYRLRIDAVKALADREGAMLVYLDGELLFATPTPLDDVGVPAASVVTLGFSNCSIPAVTAYFSNLVYQALDVSDTDGHTGTVTISGTVLKFVNGRLISVTP